MFFRVHRRECRTEARASSRMQGKTAKPQPAGTECRHLAKRPLHKAARVTDFCTMGRLDAQNRTAGNEQVIAPDGGSVLVRSKAAMSVFGQLGRQPQPATGEGCERCHQPPNRQARNAVFGVSILPGIRGAGGGLKLNRLSPQICATYTSWHLLMR